MNRTKRRRMQRQIKAVYNLIEDNTQYPQQAQRRMLSIVEREIKRRVVSYSKPGQALTPELWHLVRHDCLLGRACDSFGIREDVNELVRQALVRHMIGGKVALGSRRHLKHQATASLLR